MCSESVFCSQVQLLLTLNALQLENICGVLARYPEAVLTLLFLPGGHDSDWGTLGCQSGEGPAGYCTVVPETSSSSYPLARI